MPIARSGPPDPLLLRAARPAAPVMWFNADDQPVPRAPRGEEGASGEGRAVYSLPTTAVELSVDCQIATALVKLRVTFVNTSPANCTALFAFPTRGTVTSARAIIGDKRILETTVVPTDSLKDLVVQQQDNPLQDLDFVPVTDPSAAYIPELFRLAVPNILPGELVTVELDVLETLNFYEGSYHYMCPLAYPPGSLAGPPASCISIRCSVSSTVPNIDVRSASHDLVVVQQMPYLMQLEARSGPRSSKGFELSYSMPSEFVVAGLLVEPPQPYSMDPRGSFMLMVTPPTQPMGAVARNIVFILDRSGSMTGEPFEEAARALSHALDSLRPGDSFNIIAFDDAQTHFRLQLEPFSPASVADAKRWIEQNPPRGLTDIRTPLIWALDLLNGMPPVNAHGQMALPFVVLITDGCVNNEREICKDVRGLQHRARISTFGIGPYCNWYFLKMLAAIGRGFSSAVLYREQIFPEMARLMDRQSVPVLTDVELLMALPDCELYPFPIPDLFVGAPLTVAGKFPGQFPAAITLRGRLPTGEQYVQDVAASASSSQVPLNKVFVQQRVDVLVARQWLEDSEELRQQVTQIGVEENYPTPFTSMVAYETTPEKKAEEERRAREEWEREQQGRKDEEEGGKGGAPSSAKPTSGQSKVATAAALAIGGAVVVGAAIYMFGDSAATASGLSALGSVGHDVFSLFSADCCSQLANCISCGHIPDCSCFDPCSVVPGCGYCGDACHAIGDCLGGGCCRSIGDFGCSACHEVADCVGGGCCNWVQGAVNGGVCQFCGSCMGPVCNAVGSCLQGGACDAVGGCLGSCCETIGQCDIGSVIGSICECFCTVLSALASD